MFRIRAARPEDTAELGRVHVRGWQWGYRGQIPAGILDNLDPAERARGWREVMAEPGRGVSILLAEREDDGRVVGMASCGPSRQPDGRTGEVYAIYIEEAVAGIGLGAALLRHAVATLQGQGFERAILWVLATNARARRFYEREGWHADGAAKADDYRGFPLEEVRYVRGDLASDG
jgi:GNAT superfamily N-acetyltransferase